MTRPRQLRAAALPPSRQHDSASNQYMITDTINTALGRGEARAATRSGCRSGKKGRRFAAVGKARRFTPARTTTRWLTPQNGETHRRIIWRTRVPAIFAPHARARGAQLPRGARTAPLRARCASERPPGTPRLRRRARPSASERHRNIWYGGRARARPDRHACAPQTKNEVTRPRQLRAKALPPSREHYKASYQC